MEWRRVQVRKLLLEQWKLFVPVLSRGAECWQPKIFVTSDKKRTKWSENTYTD